MQLIGYSGRPVALVVHGDLAVFDPRFDGDDARRRFTGAMCRLAMETELGTAAGRYSQSGGEYYGRQMLLPAPAFAALAEQSDVHLAGVFAVPLEQVVARRAELGLDPS